ncbi:AEC family transporter [Albimonas sp. CAU 1670]|uniref:AEC family transporter n=1 Tax=Albimonas sp. CAU 1670 TaxID=3032599 RepID=UPI0023DBA824|nr:AEC family transporter [Albimonas sp. CAU 1670]MDF2233589.1 AEC family transporter [Albimonas sp. CAU 1670]
MIYMMIVALAPTALLIALGHVLRWRTALLPEAFWPPAEKLAYFVLLPALIVHGLATADLSEVPVAGMVAAIGLPLLVTGAGLVAVQRPLEIAPAAFTSVFQGGVRFNNYVGVTAALALFGPQGAALSAIAIATIVPIANVLCVTVFARYVPGGASEDGSAAGSASILHTLKLLSRNPLILACVVGIALHAFHLGLPPGIEGFFKALGQAALPLGLLCVGAALDRESLGRAPRLAGISMAAKFGAMPLLTALGCIAFGLDGAPAMLAVLFNALPTASSSYVLARQLGGDAPLMASLVATQTVVAALAVPLAMLAAQALFG